MPSLSQKVRIRRLTATAKNDNARFTIQTGKETIVQIIDGKQITTERVYRRIVPNVNYQENK